MPLFHCSRPRILRILAFTLLLTAGSAEATVRINEFMASNGATLADEDGDYEDWIELRNFGDAPVSLDGWGLSDNAGNPFKWVFPEGTVLEPDGFLLVWASGKDRGGTGSGNDTEPLSPDAVDGLVLRLRAADLEAAHGAGVAVWPDTSGRGNNALQPQGARRPVFAADGLNGRPVLRFNRSAAQQYFLPTAGFAGMQDFTDFTFLAVARWTGGARSGFFGGYRGTNPANAGSSVVEISDTGGGFRLRLPPTIDVTAPNALTQNQWHVVGAFMDGAAARARLTIDGALLAEARGTVGRTLLADYERVPVGSSHDDTRTFGGDIAEVLLFNRGLSAEEQAGVERYLEAYYGLADGPRHPHTNFRIAAAGEELLLTRPDGTLVDFIDPVPVPRDVSFGRTLEEPETWAYFYESTPGAANTTTPFSSLLEPVSLSRAAGAYSSAFDLTLSHPDPEVTVIYTLDGSEPDIDNLGGSTYSYVNSYPDGPFLQNTFATRAYAGPIHIADRSGEPDKLARISSTADSSPSYFPLSPVKKATVVRARAYRDGAAGPVTTATYFVSAADAFAYDMPVVSLSVDENGLFDFFDGIYVAGVDHATGSGARICNWGNYNRRGRENERAAHIEFFADGSRFLEQAGGIRIQGNCSRQGAFKSLRLYGRSSGLEDNVFDFPFFPERVPGAVYPDNTLHRRLILRTPNFYDTAFSRLYQAVYEGVGGRVRPVKQFLNGEYWGMAFLRDRFDPYYLEYHYGLDPDNITIIGMSYRHEFEPIPISFSNRVYSLSSGIPEDMAAFDAMRSFIIGSDMSDPVRFAEAEEWICIDSFIDHLVLKIFAGDDHYAPEIVYWRAREAKNDDFGDGRWRFFVKDFDSTLRSGNYVAGLATGTHPRPFGHELFTSLLDSPDFRTRFINRFADLLNTHFLPERFEEIIRHAYDEVAPVWPEVTARWRNTSLSNPDRPFTPDNRANLLNWAQHRPAVQRSHLRSHFLLQTQRTLTVDVSDPSAGRAQVNTVVIDDGTPGVTSPPYPWTGLYFPDHPVRLTALPQDGFRFIEWRVAPTGGGASVVYTDPVVELNVAAATTAEAVFAPLPPAFIETAAGTPLTFDSREWIPGDGTASGISAASSDDSVLVASVVDHALVLTPLAAGEATVELAVDSGDAPGFGHSLRVLVYGTPFAVAESVFVFDAWAADAPAGSYPPHMLFTQSDVTDPGLETPLLYAYRIPPEDARETEDAFFPYAASRRTRINGLGDEGVRFINTGRGRDLGAAVLTLDTTGASDIRVAWTAGTDLPNSRVYALRPQYRTGLDGAWTDITDGQGVPTTYVRNESAGHAQTFGPVLLPSAVENLPVVQLRWKYHHVSGSSGPRAALRLDDIIVASGAPTRFADWIVSAVPDAALRSDPEFSGPDADPSGKGIANLLRYALGLGLMEAPAERLPVLEAAAEGWVYRFPLDPSLTDITYRVRASTDLVDWSTVLFDSRVDADPQPVGGWLHLPVLPAPHRFFKLTIDTEPE
ncbi:MAG: CotH kinase family protein [Opitutales bacterium]|nr:CotH kinase family protein [Opitutales bacterium]